MKLMGLNLCLKKSSVWRNEMNESDKYVLLDETRKYKKMVESRIEYIEELEENWLEEIFQDDEKRMLEKIINCLELLDDIILMED